ncbi:crossover junction endodeoxyribonuclease RuvC [Spirochaetota bacterium]
MKILGIDPGYGILGWSIIDDNLKVFDFGTINTPKNKDLADRLLQIHDELSVIISKYKPETVAMERLFFAKNNTTAMDVAKTIGVVILLLKKSNLDYFEYTPSQVKLSITGFGRATKSQMQVMIKKIFNIKELPKEDDAADALAIAACHSFSSNCKKLNVKN